jgi:DNA-binding transcriptional ArsR family regulator
MSRHSSGRNSAFRALADPTRREILRLLRQQSRSSGEIAARFDSSWPTISRHLAVLRDAELVVTERKGQAIHYELNTSVFQDVVHHLMSFIAPAGEAAPAGERRARRRARTQEA